MRQAPSFDTISEFDKTKNSLFPVHVHVSEQGLVFVNLSANPDIIPFEVSSLFIPI
jgi:hypothetical protein